jgi:uroporphyrinogen decarboxylase
MNPKEIVHAQISHQETSYLPYTIDFENGTDVIDRLNAHYGTAVWQQALKSHIVQIPVVFDGMDWGVTEEPHTVDLFGSVWRTDTWQHYLVEPVLKAPTLEGYTWPETAKFFPDGWRERALKAIDEHSDVFTAGTFSFGLFERTWTIAGFENALMYAVAEPAFYRELVERIAAQQLEFLEEIVSLPVDGVMFSDDWGGQQGVLLGPARWRELLKEPLRRLYDYVHNAGKVVLSHCCGSIVDIVPDAIEIGLDVLESVQPEAMNPYELKRRFGEDLTFWGGLGSQSTLPFGSPDEVRAEIKRLCKKMGRGGGYILAPAKALQADTPTENGAAVVETFLEQAGVALTLT